MSLDTLIEVPEHLTKKAAGRIYRNDFCDPRGGIDPADGKLKVYDDWRWQRFLASVRNAGLVGVWLATP